MREFILCAAIWYNDGEKHEQQPNGIEIGFVVCGRRHGDCYQCVKSIVGLDEAIRLKIENAQTNADLSEHRKHQGFITNTNRYVDRKEAWEIANDANQIIYGKDSPDTDNPILISENLY